MGSRRGKNAGFIGLLSMKREKASMNARLKEQAYQRIVEGQETGGGDVNEEFKMTRPIAVERVVHVGFDPMVGPG